MMNFRILLLKILKLFTFRTLRTRLFHSIIVKRKTIFVEEICFALKKGMLIAFLGVLKEYIKELI